MNWGMPVLYWHMRHRHHEVASHGFKYSPLFMPSLVVPPSYQLKHKSPYFYCSSFWFFYTPSFYADGLFFQTYVVIFYSLSFCFLLFSSPVKPLNFYIISAFLANSFTYCNCKLCWGILLSQKLEDLFVGIVL